MVSKYKIAVIIPYFGKWPVWSDLFFYSCMQNSDIDYFFYTDCEIPEFVKKENAKNVHFSITSFREYCEKVSQRLNIYFHPQNAYKLCGLKPFYGYIHYEDIKNYDFWGFGDLDLVYGRIRHFYTDEILEKYDLFSTHSDRVSGHLFLMRNNDYYRTICFQLPKWKEKLCSNKMIGLDEGELTVKLRPYTPAFWGVRRAVRRMLKWKKEAIFFNGVMSCINKFQQNYTKQYFVEQFTTPILYDEMTGWEEPNTDWAYINGMIINMTTGKEHIYFHFMSYKRNMYYSKSYWKDDFYHLDGEHFNNIKIGKNGFDYLETNEKD